LFYRDWGGGRPVAFVHGMMMSSDMWQYQMLHLTENEFRAIAYDRRGHGRSDDPGRGYDFDTLADDLAVLLGIISAWPRYRPPRPGRRTAGIIRVGHQPLSQLALAAPAVSARQRLVLPGSEDSVRRVHEPLYRSRVFTGSGVYPARWLARSRQLIPRTARGKEQWPRG
jgi:hypothetical protein